MSILRRLRLAGRTGLCIATTAARKGRLSRTITATIPRRFASPLGTVVGIPALISLLALAWFGYVAAKVLSGGRWK